MSTYESSDCGDGNGGHTGHSGGGGHSDDGFTSKTKPTPRKKVRKRGLGIAELERMLREQKTGGKIDDANTEGIASTSLYSPCPNYSYHTAPFPQPMSLKTRQNLEQYKSSLQPFHSYGNRSSEFGHGNHNGGSAAFSIDGLPTTGYASFQISPSGGLNPQLEPPSFQGSFRNFKSLGLEQEKIIGVKPSLPPPVENMLDSLRQPLFTAPRQRFPHQLSLSRNPTVPNTEHSITIPHRRDAMCGGELSLAPIPSPSRQIIGQKPSKSGIVSSQRVVVELDNFSWLSETAKENPLCNFQHPKRQKREENNDNNSEAEDDTIDLSLKL